MAYYEISTEGSPTPWGSTAGGTGEDSDIALGAAADKARETGRHQVVRYADSDGRILVVTAEAETGTLLWPRLSSPGISPPAGERPPAIGQEAKRADMFGELSSAERGLLAEKTHNASVGADPDVSAELGEVVDDFLAPPAAQTEEQELAAWCTDNGADYGGTTYASGKKQYLVGGEALWPGEARDRFMPERARQWREANDLAGELDRGADAEAGA